MRAALLFCLLLLPLQLTAQIIFTSGFESSGPGIIPHRIGGGWFHTCGVTTAGGAKCWGANWAGELGNGTIDTSEDPGWPVPGDVQGLTSGVAAISSSGETHTCALTITGGVKCWGNNGWGQLGNGTIDAPDVMGQPVPGNVQGLGSGVTAIVTGSVHTCALTISGGVKCWGNNADGQLGNGTIDAYEDAGHPMPEYVQGLTSNVTGITAGFGHTCALTSSGGIKCWGSNWHGQLGNGTINEPEDPSRPVPGDVQGLTSGVTAITAGANFTCAMTSAGGVKCWGYNDVGQLGDGTMTSAEVPGRPVPEYVQGLTSGVTAITAGLGHACAINTSNGLKCWGGDWAGQLGDGATKPNRPVPGDVQGLTSGVMAVTAGYAHTCALMTSGGIKCWGSDLHGQLGDGDRGSFEGQPTPGDVVGFP